MKAVYVVLFTACAGFAHADCTIANAVYTPIPHVEDAPNDTATEFTVRHVVRKGVVSQTPYVLRLSDSKRPMAYDFGFAFPNGYGGTALVFEGQPDKKRKKGEGGPDGKILYFNADLQEVSGAMTLESKAPAFLIMPGIGADFHYWPGNKARFVPPEGMWKQTRCEK